jgi:streptogramin lyase
MEMRRGPTAAALLALMVVNACSDADDSRSTHNGQPSATTSGAVTSSEPSPESSFTDLDKVADHLDQGGDWLTSGAGAVWISTSSGIERLDPTSGEQVAQIAIPQGACESTTVAGGLVWTATCGQPGVARIDPANNKLTGHAALPPGTFLDSEGTIGAGRGSVWIAADGKNCHDCRVARIDARSMEVTAMIRVDSGASSVRYGFGYVWVVNPDKNLLQKVDPETERVVQTTETGISPRFFDVGEGAVWTLNQGDGTVTRVDPWSGRATSIDAGVPGGGGDLAVGGNWVWARGGDDPLLVRIDPTTNEVAQVYGPPSGSGAVTVAYGAVWVSAHDINAVWRMPLP